MCGIVGVLNLRPQAPVEREVLGGMLEAIRHRGPDGFGIYRDARIGLGSARLSIIDLSGGDQPIGNEDGTLWIVYNGEIFNYVELRPELEARGHRFSTQTDTEVIVHLYEEYGPECLQYLNGQFALALWDARRRSLFLARDRLGVRPLFYTEQDGRLIFGSEIKALLAYPGVRAEIDPRSLEQIFTFWSTLSPRTAFRDIWQLPPGCFATVEDGTWSVHRYWAPDFAVAEGEKRPVGELQEELEALLIDAARIRLRADVPVGAYLSGGLDSSLTTAIIRNFTPNRLETFSVAFENPEFDESAFQMQMADFLGTRHHVVRCRDEEIGVLFPEVIWHTETPILRTAPAPLFMLSGLVHRHGLKVVVTGEGADEVLAGYDLFKEAAIRRFWARVPESQIRPLLLQRLYPDIVSLSNTGGAYLAAFFKRELTNTASPFYSHAIRWANTARLRRFLAQPGASPAADDGAYADAIALPEEFTEWSSLGQAQYLEMTIFLSDYLLSSQGDRVAMAHSVEGRYPFLDYRVVEFCNRLPPGVKLRGLTEKWLLRQVGRGLLPEEIWKRPKRPYRAPIHRSFFPPLAHPASPVPTRQGRGGGLTGIFDNERGSPDYVVELLSEEAIRRSGLFNPVAVGQLARKAASGAALSEVEDMALTGVLSAQLVHQQFVERKSPPGERSSPSRFTSSRFTSSFQPVKVVENV